MKPTWGRARFTGRWRPGLCPPRAARPAPSLSSSLSSLLSAGSRGVWERSDWVLRRVILSELQAPGWWTLVLEGPSPLVSLLTYKQHRLSLCPSPAAVPHFTSSPDHLLTLLPLYHNLRHVSELVPLPPQKPAGHSRGSSLSSTPLLACSPWFPFGLQDQTHFFFFSQLISFLQEFLLLCIQSLNNDFCPLSKCKGLSL